VGGKPRFEGIVPALTTPFDRGVVAPGQFYDNIRRYENHALAGYLVLGSTGEAVLLDAAERVTAIRAVREAVPADKPLLVGVGAESTAAAITGCLEAADAGADAVLLGTPHYYRDAMTAEALNEHFSAVANGSPVPLLLYNVPKFTGMSLPPETIRHAAGHDNVVGLKESSGDPDYLHRVLDSVPAGFDIYCGASTLVADALGAGATGGILAAAVVIPEPLVDLAAVATTDPDRAVALQHEIASAVAPIGRHGVAGFKAAAAHRGLHGADPRPPLRPLTAEARAEITEALEAMVTRGLLPNLHL